MKHGKIILAACLIVSMALNAVPARSQVMDVYLKRSEHPNGPGAGLYRLYENSHALVIGIDDYTNGWRKLNKAVEDAEAVAQALVKRGFSVTLERNLDSRQLEAVLKKFFVEKGSTPDARLFIWFAGHGATLRGEGYLVPSDAPKLEAEAAFLLKALPIWRFGGLVRLARAKHIFAVFDSCFAGTIFKDMRTDGLPPPSITLNTTHPVRQFLTSGGEKETVPDDGVFRTVFLDALEGKRVADKSGDGYLTATEISAFMYETIANSSQALQTPRFGKLRDSKYNLGEFVFRVGPQALPPTNTQGATRAPAVVELEFWRSIDKDSSDELLLYLSRYPSGSFSEIARSRIARLDQEQSIKRRAIKWVKEGSSDTVNVRAGPGLDTKRISTLKRGSPVNTLARIRSRGEDWYQIAMDSGGVGYVLGKLLEAELPFGKGRPMEVLPPSQERPPRSSPPPAPGVASVPVKGPAPGEIPITQCDRLAAFPKGRESVAPGVWLDSISPEAVEICASAVEAYPQSSRLLFQYARALVNSRDYGLAREMAAKAEALGNSDATNLQGLMAARGWGEKQNDEKANNLYLRAALNGSPVAMTNIGWNYLIGKGLKQDFNEARHWFEQAAMAGIPSAKHGLGLMYQNGYGVPESPLEALRLYREAADEGALSAMVALGVLYIEGKKGVFAKDYQQAHEWLERAAEKGRVDAKYFLGTLHADGLGVPKNHKEAARLYREAANGDHAWAMNNLGVLYHEGKGLQRNDEEAYFWLSLAMQRGIEPIRKKATKNRNKIGTLFWPEGTMEGIKERIASWEAALEDEKE